MKIISRLLLPIRLVPRWATGGLIVILIGFIILNVMIPYSSGRLVDSLQLYRSAGIWLWFIVALNVGIVVLNMANRFFHSRYDRIVMKALYQQYIPRFFVLDQNVVELYGTGRLYSVVVKGLEAWSDFSIRCLMGPVQWVGTLLSTSVTIWFIFGVWFGMSAFVMVLCSLILGVRGTSSAKPYRRKLKDLFDEANRYCTLWMMSKQEILQNNKVMYELGRIQNLLDKTIHASWAINVQGIKYLDSTRVLSGLFTSIGGYVIVDMYLTGSLSLGVVAIFFTYCMRLRSDMLDMTRFFEDYDKSMVQIEKLREFFDTTKEIKNIHSDQQLELGRGEVVLDAVTYGYGTDQLVYQDFSLRIPAHSVTALVGPSGGGKTTLMKLIGGILEPQHGRVMVDGQDIGQINPLSYRRHIGYLTQDPSVFDGTVRENLMYGMGNEEEKGGEQLKRTIENKERKGQGNRIHDVLHKSQCQFVYDLPKGLDTEIGERGVRLSGGQKQRLAIAKIMLKDPEIILLDEPTSALDSMSEELVAAAMKELFKDRTVVIIAHRLQTVKHADRILYIDREEGGKMKEEGERKDKGERGKGVGHDFGSGRLEDKDDVLASHNKKIPPTPLYKGGRSQVVEQGTHDELIAQGGKYAKMLEIQTSFG